MTGKLTVKVTKGKDGPCFNIGSRLKDCNAFDIALLLYTLACSLLEPAEKKAVFQLLSTGMLDQIDREEVRVER